MKADGKRDADGVKAAKDADTKAKCEHVKNEADDKKEEDLSSEEKQNKSVEEAEIKQCKETKERKAKPVVTDAEAWTADMPEHIVKTSPLSTAT